MRLGKYFTLEELTTSQTATRRGLSNDPDKTSLANMRELVEHVLDPLREALGRPVLISSGYRAPAVNKAIGGAAHSQHTMGQAADFIVPGMTPDEVVAFIQTLNLPVDQGISEMQKWTHVSHGPRHRRQFLRARRTPAGVKYEAF